VSLEQHYENYWRAELPPPVHDALTETRHALLRDRLNNNDRRVLDVGAGTGALVDQLGVEGRDATGFDIAQRAVDLALARFPSGRFIRWSAENLPWPIEPRSHDVVVAFEVIEHLLQPRQLIRGAHEALRRGGHLALTTPYHGFFKNIVLSTIAFDHHFNPEGDHIRFFSDAGLRELLESEGFVVETVRHFGRAWPVWAGVFIWARKQ
jgi:2-polyprenyl-3-methyl-5-hydroxy-6-metoxy-1,4-benzoquinol methylase